MTNILIILGVYFLVALCVAAYRLYQGEPLADWGVAWLPKLILDGVHKLDEWKRR